MPINIAIIGAGAVSDYHHVPGIRLDPRARLVGACDSSAELLEKRRKDWGITNVTTDYEKICAGIKPIDGRDRLVDLGNDPGREKGRLTRKLSPCSEITSHFSISFLRQPSKFPGL